uniref:CPBP family intramembrane metalloprotease n=1 Tax=Phenylobacterium glaciei TaxID=2803784 RepID=A0A974P1N5_9CAUL|nr:CPBP family intramembrane metalloprotease [Phenylobacterium glaciei]
MRGVALPLLLSRTGPRRASLALGVCWALWHLPVLLGKPPLVWLGQLILTVSVSLILTFVWVRFRPSLAAAILFHGALNGWSVYAAQGWVPGLEALDAWQIIRLAALLLIALALLPLRWSPAPRGDT